MRKPILKNESNHFVFSVKASINCAFCGGFFKNRNRLVKSALIAAIQKFKILPNYLQIAHSKCLKGKPIKSGEIDKNRKTMEMVICELKKGGEVIALQKIEINLPEEPTYAWLGKERDGQIKR